MPAPRLRLMVEGFPKNHKTGGVAALLNAGFEVGVISFDGLVDPLYAYTKPEMLKNLSVVVCQDRKTFGISANGGGKEFVQVTGEPVAIRRAISALNNWSKSDPDHDWGPVATWGPNRVLLVDNLTEMGEASFNRIRFINNRNQMNTRDSDYGLAMKDQEGLVSKLMSEEYHCHVIVIAHLKWIGPKLERINGDNDPLLEAKAALSAEKTAKQPYRMYPSALGHALPQEILRHVPAAVWATVRNGQRVYVTRPQPDVELDLGVPAPGLKEFLPVETGMLDIMRAVTGKDKPE